MQRYWPWGVLLVATASLVSGTMGYLEFSFPTLLLGWAMYIVHVALAEWRLWKTILLSTPLVLTPLFGIWQEVRVLGSVFLVIMTISVVAILVKTALRYTTIESWYVALVPIALMPTAILGAFSYGLWGVGALGLYVALTGCWWIPMWRRIWYERAFPETVEEDEEEHV